MGKSVVGSRGLLVGGALLVLLGVVSLASRGERPSSGGGGSSRALPVGFFDYVFTFALAFGLLMLVVSAYYRAELRSQGKGGWEVKQMAMFLGAVAVVCVVAVIAMERIADQRGKTLQTTKINTGIPTGASTATDERRRVRRKPKFEWEAVVIAAAMIGGVYGVYAVFRPKKRGRSGGSLREDIALILEDTLDKLWAEEDPRRAVILAYAWMERTLAAYGLPRAAAETPLEYLSRVLVDLDASKSSVFELTALFERAKFSSHEIDVTMKEEAIAALSAVRDELRKPAAE